jgi:hypothetical protein
VFLTVVNIEQLRQFAAAAAEIRRPTSRPVCRDTRREQLLLSRSKVRDADPRGGERLPV